MSEEQSTRARAGTQEAEHAGSASPGGGGDGGGGLRNLLPALRRSQRFILLWVLASFCPAAAYIFSITPTYRATALATIDMRELNLGEVSSLLNGPRASTDVTIVRTEVQVLQSEGLARRVVADLGLVDHPDFAWRPSGRDQTMQRLAGMLRTTQSLTGLPFGRIASNLVASGGTMGASSEQNPAARLAWATEAYMRGLSVSNDGRSFVLSVGFRSTDPKLAATIANRHLALYIEHQRAAKREDLRNAHAWLEQEVAVLSAKVREAEQTVQAYREEHRLFSSGGVSAAARMLSDMNGQLSAARADLATKEGRLRSSLAGVRRQAADTDVDVTNSGTVSRLREQEATVRRREAELATRLGARHPDVLAVRAELREIQSKTAEEVQKILTGFGGSTAAAQDRVRELQRGIAELEQRVVESDRAEAGARDLERIAAATRTLYETLLARQQQVAAQAGIQRPDAILVSSAEPPIWPSSPNTMVFLVVALMGSAGSGIGFALLRDRLRARVLSLESASTLTGLPSLGVLPRAPFGRPIHQDVVDRPKSAAAEAVRSLRSSLVLARPGGMAASRSGPRVLAVTSALPGEGKTSTAVALARSMAASGLSVILLDADLRNPAVAKMVWGRPAGSPGLGVALAQQIPLDDLLLSDDLTSLRVLHADADPEAPPPQDLLGSDTMRRLIEEAAQTYDYVIIDTPPAGLVTDAALLGQMVEAIILVTRWNRTPIPALVAAARSLRAAHAPVAGVVMTDADASKLLDHSEGAIYAIRGRRRYFEG